MKIIISIICFVYLFAGITFPQQYNFAWLSDIHIGAPNGESDLRNVINDINSRTEIEFVVITGNITETGSNAEFEKAKEILDALNVSYYVIPGAHDTRWSESGCTYFADLWEYENFVFDFNGTRHIGLNSGICWQGGGGHFAPQYINWLEEVLDTTGSSQEIYFYTYYPLDSTIDNWFSVTNLLSEKNIKIVFTGYTDVNSKPPFANTTLSFNGIPSVTGRSTLSSKAPQPAIKRRSSRKADKSWGYTFVENKTDSLIFYEVTSDSLLRQWSGISKKETLQISKIDPVSNEIISDKITLKWNKELDTELSAPLLVSDDKIFAVTRNGFVYCYDLNGNLKWEYDTGGSILSKPIRDKDILAVTTVEGDLFAFNANNGSVIQVLSIGETLTSQLIKTDIVYNGYKTSGIIIGTANGKVFCYDIYSLEQIWENNSAKGLINTEPLLINDRIIYGSWDNNLYCIDAGTGQLNWVWKTPAEKNAHSTSGFSYYSPAGCTPVSDDKYVYITAPDKNVTAIDLLLGRTIWRKNNFNGWESIGLSNDRKNLLIKSLKDKLIVVNAISGKQVREIDAGYGLDVTKTKPIEWNGNILFGTASGNIYLVDSAFNVTTILFTGSARVNTIEYIKDNLFAASNIDGSIFIFEIK